MVDPLVVLTGAILAPILLVSLVLAFRTPLSLRIALRNILRARRRTILVVLGLLVGTAIVSGSLAVGDTVGAVNVHYAYLEWGYVDEAIYGTAASGGYLYYPTSLASSVIAASSSDRNIAGMAPEVIGVTQVFDARTGIPQTNLNLVGSNASESAGLGAFTSTSGANPGEPSIGHVFLDSLAAQDLNAATGDSLTLYGSSVVHTTVGAIVKDDSRGGFLTAGISGGTVFADLATAQAIENVTGQVNFLAVTNVGSQVDGLSLSSAVATQLNATLKSLPGTTQLAVHEVLNDAVSAARSASTSLTTIFLVFGLFCIVAGSMLIIGIFTMIAEERKGEMGMLRAVGLTRRVVVLSYYFEGLIYSLGSALVGTLVGVAAGFLLLYGYVLLVSAPGAGTGALLSSFTISSSSLLTSYLVGFLLTLATVALASIRVSRLNIVRAIRDVPEPPPPLRTYTFLAYVGVIALIGGMLLFFSTYRGTSDASLPILGGSAAIIGTALVGSRFVKNRTVFSAAGLGLLVWSGVAPLQNFLLGSGHSGTIFYVFVEGILMVAAALMIVAFNGPALARAIERLVTGHAGATPVTRVGLSYPSRRAARTSITLTIFALVLFTIVLLAVYSATLTGNLNNSIETQSGGYTYLGVSARPIPDLPGALASNSTLSGLYAHVVPIVTGQTDLLVKGFSANPYRDSVFSAPANASPTSSFYGTERYPFLSTYHGLSGAAVMSQLSSNASVAVVDGNYASGGGFTFNQPHPLVGPGDVVEVVNPATGVSANVTVLGVLKQSILDGIWINPSEASRLGYMNLNGYLLTVNSGVSSTTAAQLTKAAFYPYGLVLIDFKAILADTTTIISADIGLLEVFIALGLAVGIAALGILALRAVTERRREIGMLRATGLTRPMILKAFLVEYSFVTIVGALVGGLLGVLLDYNLTISPSGTAAGVTTLFVPWFNLLVVILVTGLLATLAVIGPSLRAARLPPAEAIRGIE